MAPADRDTRPGFLTPREVADVLRVSDMTVYRLIRAGDLRALRVGRAYRIREDDFDEYLSTGLTEAG